MMSRGRCGDERISNSSDREEITKTKEFGDFVRSGMTKWAVTVHRVNSSSFCARVYTCQSVVIFRKTEMRG